MKKARKADFRETFTQTILLNLAIAGFSKIEGCLIMVRRGLCAGGFGCGDLFFGMNIKQKLPRRGGRSFCESFEIISSD